MSIMRVGWPTSRTLRCTCTGHVAVDLKNVLANHARLAELAQREEVTVFSAHDPVEYRALLDAARHPDN